MDERLETVLEKCDERNRIFYDKIEAERKEDETKRDARYNKLQEEWNKTIRNAMLGIFILAAGSFCSHEIRSIMHTFLAP